MLKKAQDIKKIIERFKQELRKFNINSDKIILYGSYAKGNPREDSDIDLVVMIHPERNYTKKRKLFRGNFISQIITARLWDYMNLYLGALYWMKFED